MINKPNMSAQNTETPSNASDLYYMISAVRKKIEDACDEQSEREGIDMNYAQMNSDVQREQGKTFENLRDHPVVRFSFRTERGSRYIVTNNGDCLRMKTHEDGSENIEPATKKIFFLPPEEIERLRGEGLLKDKDYLIGKPIRICEPRINASPLEFGTMIDPAEAVLSIEGDTLTIEGCRWAADRPIDTHSTGPIHIGHPIVEINMPKRD